MQMKCGSFFVFAFWKLEWEDVHRIAQRRWEREQGRRDATEDMSEDLSEGEKGDVLGEAMVVESPRKKFQRNSSNLEVWSDSNKEKKLYIVLIRYCSVKPLFCRMFVGLLDLSQSLGFWSHYFSINDKLCNVVMRF